MMRPPGTQMSRETTVTVVGSLNVDITLRTLTLPVPGETVLASGRSSAFGGKGGNQAIAASALGGNVDLVGAVGADDEGRGYVQELMVRGVRHDGVLVQPDARTGVGVIVVDADAENFIIVDAGANATLRPDWVRQQVTKRPPGILLGQLEVPIDSLEAAAAAIDDTCTFILNPAPMALDPGRLAHLLARADILTPNRKELGQLAGRPEPTTGDEVDRCVEALSFDGTVIVTLGRDGAAVYQPGQARRNHRAPTVEALDTSGAGDAFCGALGVALSRGADLNDATGWAVEIASRATCFAGAQLRPDIVVGTPVW